MVGKVTLRNQAISAPYGITSLEMKWPKIGHLRAHDVRSISFRGNPG